MRWRLRLEEYDYEIEYKKSKENGAADALSRLHPIHEIAEPELFKELELLNDNTYDEYLHWKEK